MILASDEHKDLCKDLVDKYQVEYTAGKWQFNLWKQQLNMIFEPHDWPSIEHYTDGKQPFDHFYSRYEQVDPVRIPCELRPAF